MLAEAAPVGIYIADADGGVVYANDRWQQIYGLDGGEVLNDRWADAVHPEDRAEALETWHQAIRTGV
ncbi:MAG: PAS domain-containing protein, partial [Rhodanobacter sp.]